ncbi:hypothetical protein F383_04790 [Gossypium arboreum]|uniref:Uncharacterized protein n=1 Tax=Gossypium arboreum TaxID=29729 RepID=A0A0B0PRJ5_GOSAR|nr:hypothetical protein F383_19504 [Gossypium arboreum]KHG14444.1 hypothetical protein F383_18759 [Gossypium arboreum]KHG18804.1 hypothetical protein F383_24565 [Gossypium arboreum]KHG27054.1 hypothetical protein F383_04790 [Gossypium arboreum]
MNFWHQSRSFTIMCHLRSRQKHLVQGEPNLHDSPSEGRWARDPD